jgi:hypothetical protein
MTAKSFLTKLISLILLLSIYRLNAQCPKINSILVDACGATEGTDEFFTFTTGDRNVYVDSLNVDYPNTAVLNYCNSGCGTNTLINNSTFINTLNSTAGCSLFVYSSIIPANSRVVVFAGSNPSSTLNFSTLCSETIYVVFSNNTSTTGRFANYSSGTGIRTLKVKFGSCIDSVKYDKALVRNSNGAYIDFDSLKRPTYLVSSSCNYTDVLPNNEINLKVRRTIDELEFTVESDFSFKGYLQYKVGNRWEDLTEIQYQRTPINFFLDTEYSYYRIRSDDGITSNMVYIKGIDKVIKNYIIYNSMLQVVTDTSVPGVYYLQDTETGILEKKVF